MMLGLIRKTLNMNKLVSSIHQNTPHADFVSHVCFKNVDELCSDGLPKSAFHTQDEDAKKTLLGQDASNVAPVPPADDILARLAELSPKTASAFEHKPISLCPLVFRLYDERPVSTSKKSFVALSYRWNNSKADKHVDGKFPFPISKGMMSAVLEERISESEGFWYDQGCIDQENGEEKSFSIGMMDLIYREARAVIVALDDVLLTKTQVDAVMEYKDSYDKACLALGPAVMNWCLLNSVPSLLELANRPIFRHFVHTILQSSRFGRAWCSHEAYLAHELIFLVGCEPQAEGPRQSRRFLRFTSSFCYNIMRSTNLWDLGNHIPRMSRELIGICAKIGMRKAEEVQAALPDALRTKSQLSDAREHMLATAADVFSMVAGGDPWISDELRMFSANRDKLSIALNTAEWGIMLKYMPAPEWSLFSEDNCFRILTVFALASGNPEALCTNGYMIALEKDPTDEIINKHEQPQSVLPPTFSCFSRPTTVSSALAIPILDSPSNLILGSRQGSDFLKIDLLLITNQAKSNRPHYPRMPLHRPTYRGPIQSEEGLSSLKPQAQFFGRFFSGEGGDSKAANEPTIDNALENSTDPHFDAAILFYKQCMVLGIGISSASSIAPPADSEYAKVYQSLTIEILSNCIQLGPDWIVATSQWRGFSPTQHLNDLDLSPLFPSLEIKNKECEKAAEKLLEFVESLRREGLPLHAGNSCAAYWRVMIIQDSNGIPAISFGPCFDDVALAVPSCLLSSAYASLSRCWVLLKTNSPDEFHFIGKSKLIAPRYFNEGIGDKLAGETRLSTVFGQLKGTWASLSDVAAKCAQLDLDGSILIKECAGLINDCSKEAASKVSNPIV